jgi:TetR/AcrR family transcriptional regulator, mexJK operon transcriptional repressor
MVRIARRAPNSPGTMPTPPLETAPFRRGPGGRPTREEAERRHQALLAAAGRLFLEGGLSGTSIDAIAAEAGVAKRFIYARYADKGELFVAAIGRFIEGRVSPLASFEIPAAPVETGLLDFARMLLDLALRPEPRMVYRTLVIEAARFPNLTRQFIDGNRGRITSVIGRVLEAYAERGEIAIEDPALMAEQFFILTAGFGQRLASIGIYEEPEAAERRLTTGIRLFLHGCRVAS